MLIFQFKPYLVFHGLVKVVPVGEFSPDTLHLNWKGDVQLELDSIKNSYQSKRYMFPKPPYSVVDFEGKDGNGKLRFKGDYKRHIQREEWSFRLKTKEDSIFKAYKKLNFHHPSERLGINEYVFQKYMQKRGHLGLDYEFAYVVKNNVDTVLYAYEECIGKAYLKKRNLKGVVLRFDEAPFFNWMMYLVPDSFPPSLINTFLDSSRIIHNGKLKAKKEMFELAHAKLGEWKDGRLKTSEVFKLDKTADFLSLIDVWGAQHVIGLNNLKFYFDPVDSLFELIATDGNSHLVHDILGNSDYKIHQLFFADEEFKKEYLSHVRHYSNGRDISSFLVRNIGGITGRMGLLKSSYPKIDNNLAYLYHNFNVADEKSSE